MIDEDLGPLGSKYDANRDRSIDKREVVMAIDDYLFGDVLTKEEMIQVIVLYLFPSG